jgi:hypothetical protein
MKLRAANVHLKLLALVLAAVTWFALRGRTIKQSDYMQCAVALEHPADVKVRDKDKLVVEIRVRGPADRLDRFRPDDQTLRLDARKTIAQALAEGKSAAMVSVEVARTDFDLPARFELSQYTPQRLQFWVERLENKELPIEVDTATLGAPADGYRIVGVRAEPPTVPITLGADEATRITAVRTAPVDVRGCTETVHSTASLLDPREPSRRLGPLVEVTVAIAPDLDEKSLSPVPITVLRRPNDKRTVAIEPQTTSVTVRARRDVLVGVGPEDVQAYFVLDEKLEQNVPYELPLKIVITKPGVELVKAGTVRVTIE